MMKYVLATSVVFMSIAGGSSVYGLSIEGKVTVLDHHGRIKEDASGVVVFLDELERPPVSALPGRNPAMRQVHKKFVPQVLPVVAGTTVDFLNDDSIYHNVFSLSTTKTFDLGLYKQGTSQSVAFDQTGLVKVYCNIHPNMVGYILVLSNPYFTITDPQGHFMIPDPPLGAVTVRAWHEKGRQHPEKKIYVTSEGIHNIDLTVVENIELEVLEETISIKHKNKWGEDYPSKY